MQADQRTLQTRHVTIVKFESNEVVARLISVLDDKNDDIVLAALSILKKMAKLSKREHFLVDNCEMSSKIRSR